jgi:hypothetical protein
MVPVMDRGKYNIIYCTISTNSSVTGHNGDQIDGQKFSVPAAHQPQKSAEEMSRMSHLISSVEEVLISSWQSQVTRGKE